MFSKYKEFISTKHKNVSIFFLFSGLFGTFLRLFRILRFYFFSVIRLLKKRIKTFSSKYFSYFDNYLVGVMLLILFKLLNYILFSIRFSFFYNYILLILFIIIAKHLNLINHLKLVILKLLIKFMPNGVTDTDLIGAGPGALEDYLNQDKYKHYIHYMVIYIIQLRLFLNQEIYFFIVFNFLLIQFLLLNRFIVLIGFYKLILLIFKVILFLLDRNMQKLKSNLSYYNKNLKFKKYTLKATKNNSILLSYWIMRNNIPNLKMFTDNFIPTYNYDYLEFKVDEQYIFEIPHKFLKNAVDFDIYEKNKLFYSFIRKMKSSIRMTLSWLRYLYKINIILTINNA